MFSVFFAPMSLGVRGSLPGSLFWPHGRYSIHIYWVIVQVSKPRLRSRKVKSRNSPREGEGTRKDEGGWLVDRGHLGNFGVDSDNSRSYFWKLLVDILVGLCVRTKEARSLCPVCGTPVSLWHGACGVDVLEEKQGRGWGRQVRLMCSVGCGKHLQTARQREGAVRKECEVFVEVFVGSWLHFHVRSIFKGDISELRASHLW